MAIVDIRAEKGEDLRGCIGKINAALQPNTVTISKEEYEGLLKDSETLNALRNHGVDNWDGYDDAISELCD